MSKFQVIKCQPMQNKPDATSKWLATMVKGLYTDDSGEVEMVEAMLFGERGAAPPNFTPGEQLTPVFQVRRNKQTQRPEFFIGAFLKLKAA